MDLPSFSADTAGTPDGRKRLRAAYDEQGFVVVRGVVPKAGLVSLTLALGEALSRARVNGVLFEGGGGTMAGHINCYPGEPSRFAFDALVQHGVVELIRDINPELAGAVRAGCNMNLPNSVAQNWHIDGAFHKDFMIANVAVVDTVIQNGAIDLLPESHKRPEPYWRLAFARGFRSHRRVEMGQGDVLVRSSRLWHRGMPNLSGAVRPMLGFTFGEVSGTTGDVFSAHGGAIQFSPNRFATSRLGKLRERSYVAAPFAHEVLRIARSLLGKDGYA
jgi:ectoine hydroxylase-related dioxygenase (phytanoyl-CoA dioxygenase family)